MSVLSRLLLALILALGAIAPAAAVQPKGSAGWTTEGWVNFTGILYTGPGVRYPTTGNVEAGIRVRVDRCSGLWCLVHTSAEKGWLPLSDVSFGQEPWSPFTLPKSPVRYGGNVCFFSGANYRGAETCYEAGEVSRDLVFAGLDNNFRSVKILGGSVLACRDRNFRSYCKYLNESYPQLDPLLSGAISSIHVF
jgi:hypothetical protein